jgi:peptide/nickel transport system permease protein
MSTGTTAAAAPAQTAAGAGRRSRTRVLRDPRITRQLVVGVAMLAAIVLFALVGPFLVDDALANVTAVIPRMPPSAEHWLGSDTQGRDLWTVMVLAVPNTLKIGLIAGVVGTVIGVMLALIAGFFGGITDGAIRIVSDSLLTVPAIALLVIIAANVEQMTVELMALTVAALAWMFPTRTIRAQVLTIRERSYVEVARANGVGSWGLIFREVMPNLMPFIAASFVGAVAGAMLAAIGLEALGLGAIQTQTLGVTIYWSQEYTAVLRGMWWWWAPPVVVISLIFIALFLTSAGMDRFANPRLRRD